MKQKIIKSLEERLAEEISSRSHLKYLKQFQVEDYIDEIISTVYLYTRMKRGINKTIYFSELITAVGHNVRKKLGQKTDSSLAAKTGAFILYTFEVFEIIELILGKSRKTHAAYIVDIKNDDKIVELWRSLDPTKIEKLPSKEPYAPWTSSKHETGINIVKTRDKEVLKKLNPKTTDNI